MKKIYTLLIILSVLVLSESAFSQLTLANPTLTATRCSAIGIFSTTASGGTAPYSYSLTGTTTAGAPVTRSAQNSGTFANLAAGSYTVLVTDFIGATASVNGSISNQYTLPAQPTVVVNGPTVTMTAQGGRLPYRYGYIPNTSTDVWVNNHIQNSNVFACVPDGTWAFVTYDSCGNYFPVQNIVISTPAFPQGVCTANVNGTATIAIDTVQYGANHLTYPNNGNALPYTFVCTNQLGAVIATNNSGRFDNVSGCAFRVRYTDRCGKQYPSQYFNCTANPLCSDISGCMNGQQGTINAIQGIGGTPPYTYAYTNPITNNTTMNTTGIFTGLPNNFSYIIKTTDGCGTSINREFTYKSVDTAWFECPYNGVINYRYRRARYADTASVYTAHGQLLNYCNAVSTQVFPITVELIDGITLLQTQTIADASALSGSFNAPLFSSYYKIVCRDACGVADTITPRSPTTLDAHVVCANDNAGEVTLQAFGGQPPYTYEYIGSPANTSGNTTGHYTGLPTNTPFYYFYVRDACGSVTISINNEPQVAPYYLCPFDGSVYVDNGGGDFGYIYNSSKSGYHKYPDGISTSGIIASAAYYTDNHTVAHIENYTALTAYQGFTVDSLLNPLGYLVFENICGDRDTIDITQTYDVFDVTVRCDTVSAILPASPPLDPATSTFRLFNPLTMVTIATNNTGVFYNVPPGGWVMEAITSGCTASAGFLVTSPTTPDYSVVTYGRTINGVCRSVYALNIENGNTNMLFTIRGGPNNINLTAAAGAALHDYEFDNLLPGTYYISNFCTKDTIVLPEPQYNLQITRMQPVCASDGVRVNVSGGNPIPYYTGLINNNPTLVGHTTNSNDNDTYTAIITSQNGSTSSVSGGTGGNGQFNFLPQGSTYTAYIYTNSSGYGAGDCPVDTATFFAPYYIRPTLSASIGVVCAGSSTSQIYAAVSNGTPPFTFSIDPASVPAGYTGQTTIVTDSSFALFTGLPPGSYQLHVQDFCLISADYAASIVPYTFTPNFVRYCNGRIKLSLPTITGATYQWQTATGAAIGTTPIVFTNDAGAANYNVTVSVNSCNYTHSISVPAQTDPDVVADAGADITLSAFVGTATITQAANNPTVGTGTWAQLAGPVSTIQNANSYNTQITLLEPNIYTYIWTVEGGAGSCVATDTMQVVVCTSVVPTQASLAAITGDCHGGGSITPIFLTSSLAEYTYQWSNGLTTGVISNLPIGIYTITITPNNICGTTIVLRDTLDAIPVTTTAQTFTACGSFTYNNIIYTNNTTLTETIQTISGCDSIITTTNIIIHNPQNTTQNFTACGSFSYNNIVYTNNITLTETLQTIHGCDSIVTTDIVINNAQNTAQNFTACGSFTYNNIVYTNNIILTETLQTTHGCDSIVTTNIVINNAQSTTQTFIACGSFSYNNIVYTNNITLTETLQTIHGCDSIITTNIVINNAQSTTQTFTACGSFSYNNIVYTNNIVFTETLQTIHGCDSLVTTNIIINPIKNTAQTFTACGSFSYNNIIYTNSITLTETLQTIHGCDSIVTTMIVINTAPAIVLNGTTAIGCNSPTTRITATGGSAYTWNTGGNTAILTVSSAGTYTVTATNNVGCSASSSVIIVQLLPIVATTVVVQPRCHDEENGSITITAVQNALQGTVLYSLDNQAFTSDSVFSNLSSGTYIVKAIDGNQCAWSANIVLRNPPALTVELPTDATLNLGNNIRLMPIVPGFPAVAYDWQPATYLSCTNCRQPICTPLRDITYTVTVTNSLGCTATDNMDITINDDKKVYIPNTFTPNTDGKNDIFTAYSGVAAVAIQKMQIFDRWGQLIYEGKNLPINGANTNEGWDGKFKGAPLNPAVFVYTIEILFIDNTTKTYSGDVTLVN